MWQRWQKKAIEQTKLQSKFSEKILSNRVGSDIDTTENSSELLGYADTTTFKKHCRNAPVKVTPFIKK